MFKRVGDIIRIHRCSIGQFKDRKTISAIIPYHSSWAIFDGREKKDILKDKRREDRRRERHEEQVKRRNYQLQSNQQNEEEEEDIDMSDEESMTEDSDSSSENEEGLKSQSQDGKKLAVEDQRQHEQSIKDFFGMGERNNIQPSNKIDIPPTAVAAIKTSSKQQLSQQSMVNEDQEV